MWSEDGLRLMPRSWETPPEKSEEHSTVRDITFKSLYAAYDEDPSGLIFHSSEDQSDVSTKNRPKAPKPPRRIVPPPMNRKPLAPPPPPRIPTYSAAEVLMAPSTLPPMPEPQRWAQPDLREIFSTPPSRDASSPTIPGDSLSSIPPVWPNRPSSPVSSAPPLPPPESLPTSSMLFSTAEPLSARALPPLGLGSSPPPATAVPGPYDSQGGRDSSVSFFPPVAQRIAPTRTLAWGPLLGAAISGLALGVVLSRGDRPWSSGGGMEDSSWSNQAPSSSNASAAQGSFDEVGYRELDLDNPSRSVTTPTSASELVPEPETGGAHRDPNAVLDPNVIQDLSTVSGPQALEPQALEPQALEPQALEPQALEPQGVKGQGRPITAR